MAKTQHQKAQLLSNLFLLHKIKLVCTTSSLYPEDSLPTPSSLAMTQENSSRHGERSSRSNRHNEHCSRSHCSRSHRYDDEQSSRSPSLHRFRRHKSENHRLHSPSSDDSYEEPSKNKSRKAVARAEAEAAFYHDTLTSFLSVKPKPSRSHRARDEPPPNSSRRHRSPSHSQVGVSRPDRESAHSPPGEDSSPSRTREQS